MCVVLSRCFRVGWTGLGWATPWWWQAPMRSHRPGGVRVGSTGQYEDSTRNGASAGYWVRPHPDRLCGSWEVFERLSGDVAFQAAHDLACGEAFGSAAPHVVAGLGVAGHAGQHDLVERRVGVSVSAMIQVGHGLWSCPIRSGLVRRRTDAPTTVPYATGQGCRPP